MLLTGISYREDKNMLQINLVPYVVKCLVQKLRKCYIVK